MGRMTHQARLIAMLGWACGRLTPFKDSLTSLDKGAEAFLGVLALHNLSGPWKERRDGGLFALIDGDTRALNRRHHAERGAARDGLGEGDGLLKALIVRGDLLDEPKAKGLIRVKTIAREEPAHRVPIARTLREANRCAAKREDAAVDLDLPKDGALFGDRNIGGEEELDANGQRITLCHHHERFFALLAIK